MGCLSRRKLYIFIFLKCFFLYSEPQFALTGFFFLIKAHDTFHSSDPTEKHLPLNSPEIALVCPPRWMELSPWPLVYANLLTPRGTAKYASHLLLVGVEISTTFLESNLVICSKNLKNTHIFLTECIIILLGIFPKKLIRNTKDVCYTKDDCCSIIKTNKLSVLFSRILNIRVLVYHCSLYSTNICLRATENLIVNKPSTPIHWPLKVYKNQCFQI